MDVDIYLQVLQDKDRLIKRTQLKRSVYHVLGKEDGEAGEEVSYDSHLKSHDSHLKLHDSHLKLHDEEIYDEDDFYHQVCIKCMTSVVCGHIYIIRF